MGYGSPLSDNTGCVTETVPTSATTPTGRKCNADTGVMYQGVVGLWYQPYVGTMGRLQYGLQYSLTGRKICSEISLTPNADENMVLTSMRYYLS